MRTKRSKSLHETYGQDAPLALSIGIRDAAESVTIPGRFMIKQGAVPSSVVILDTETGRHAEVALCNYRGVRSVLAALFGDEQ